METGKLVIPEAIGTGFATLAGPAHTGGFARAAEQDRVAFQRRIQMSDRLGQLKDAIVSGRLDRIAWGKNTSPL